MNDIKIRYTVQHEETGRIMSKVFTLKEIELSKSVEWLKSDAKRYGVIARDLFTGVLDKNKTEIYKNSLVLTDFDDEIRVVEWCYEEASFKCRHLPGKHYCEAAYLQDGEFEVAGTIYEPLAQPLEVPQP